MEFIAFLVTVVVGFVADNLFIRWNWPDAGAIFAIATAGVFILWAIRHKKEEK